MNSAIESECFVFGTQFLFPNITDGYASDFTQDTAFYSDETLYRSKIYCPLYHQDTEEPITENVHMVFDLLLQILPMDSNDRPVPYNLSVRSYYKDSAWTALCELMIYGKPSRAYDTDTGITYAIEDDFSFGGQVSFVADPY